MQHFADESCTQPAIIQSAESCGMWLPGAVSRTQAATGGCASVEYLDTRAVQDPVEQVYEQSGADCVAVPLDADQLALALGPPLGLHAFAWARLEVW